MEEPKHISVMPEEALAQLNLRPGSVVIDGTLGMGGHAALMAQKLGARGHLIGIDRDKSALEQAKKRLAAFPLRVDLFQGNFADIDSFAAQAKVAAVDGILLDLGISSMQLDDPQRGFAFKHDGALDMRMDQNHGRSAADLVNTLSVEELADIIYQYGEERFSRRIAQAIVQTRARQKFTTTAQLADVILRALPHGYTRGRIHPATRTFQALRIVVNDELESIKKGLQKSFALLAPGGRLCVIAFHSLEDRIVKTMFRAWADEGVAQLMTKKPLSPGDVENESNARARSAKLRALEKIK